MTSGTIASTAGYCPLVLLTKDMSEARTAAVGELSGRGIQCVSASGILSYMPRQPALSDTCCDLHLDLVKDRNSPDDLESKTCKQQNAPHVGRANAGHERLLFHAELVAHVQQEQDKCCVCPPLAAVCGLCRR